MLVEEEACPGTQRLLIEASAHGGALALSLSLASCVGDARSEVAQEAIMGSAPVDVILDRAGRVAINDPRQHARDATGGSGVD